MGVGALVEGEIVCGRAREVNIWVLMVGEGWLLSWRNNLGEDEAQWNRYRHRVTGYEYTFIMGWDGYHDIGL